VPAPDTPIPSTIVESGNIGRPTINIDAVDSGLTVTMEEVVCEDQLQSPLIQHDISPESQRDMGAHQQPFIGAETDHDTTYSDGDIVDDVTALFDEMDHTMTRMAEVMSKCISTEPFSNLSSRVYDLCSVAQEVFRADLARRQSSLDIHMEGVDQDKERLQAADQQSVDDVATKLVHLDQPPQNQISVDDPGEAIAPILYPVPQACKDVVVSRVRPVSRKGSEDAVMEVQNEESYMGQHQDHSQSCESENQSTSSVSIEEKQSMIRDYVSTLKLLKPSC